MNTDHIRTLHHTDLNLLVALDALTQERSVTRAAARAGVSQSAMSHTLRRLRELFADPLLVRGQGGMVLTPRAEALVVPLRSGLTSLARLLAQPDPFDPATARRAFRIVSPDLFDVLLLPALLQDIGAAAPGVDFAVVPMPSNLNASLETGDIDLAIHPVLLDPKPFDLKAQADTALQRRTLFRDHFRCFVRRGHPSLNPSRPDSLSLETYTTLRHILVSPGGDGPGVVDRFLAEQNLERRIALRVPNFSAALAIAAQSDLVLTAPASLARVSSAADLVGCAPPLDLPAHAVTLLWHPRFTEDLGHRWLRDRLVRVTADMRPSTEATRSSRISDGLKKP